MPYITEIQTIEAAGIPVIEYRTQPQIDEQRLITIEFTPPATNDKYLVKQPEFVFGDTIIIKEQWDNCFLKQLDTEGLDTFSVCAMELVEPKNNLGQEDWEKRRLGEYSTSGWFHPIPSSPSPLVSSSSLLAIWSSLYLWDKRTDLV